MQHLISRLSGLLVSSYGAPTLQCFSSAPSIPCVVISPAQVLGLTVFQLFLLSLCSSVSGPSLPLLSIYIPLLCVSTVYSHCSAVSLPSCIFPLPPPPRCQPACLPLPSVRPSFTPSISIFFA